MLPSEETVEDTMVVHGNFCQIFWTVPLVLPSEETVEEMVVTRTPSSEYLAQSFTTDYSSAILHGVAKNIEFW